MKQLTGLGRPVQERTYVPNAHGEPGYREQAQLVSRIDLREDGSDRHLKVFCRGFAYPVGYFNNLPPIEADALLDRLFRDPPTIDRELCGKMLDDLEDAIVRGDAQGRARARRMLLRTLYTMAADLHLMETVADDPHAFDAKPGAGAPPLTTSAGAADCTSCSGRGVVVAGDGEYLERRPCTACGGQGVTSSGSKVDG